jgi:hypothetical protein
MNLSDRIRNGIGWRALWTLIALLGIGWIAPAAQAQVQDLGSVFLFASESNTFSVNSTESITWSVEGDGSVDQSGNYTAPDDFTADHDAHVVASDPDGNVIGRGTVHLIIPIDIQPRNAEVEAGGTVQYTTNVTVPVVWTLPSGPGSIDQNGLYRAPDDVPVEDFANVIVTAQDGSGRFIGVNLVVKEGQGKPLTVNPATQVQLKAGETQQFSVTPAGTDVDWTVTGGTITPDGNFTAPPFIPTDTLVTVTATKKSDRSKSSISTVLLLANLTLNPATASLHAGETATFSATPALPMSWSVPTGEGSITQQGVYTAPSSISANHSISVVGTATDGTGRTAQATVELLAPVAVSHAITPASATLQAGQTQQFTVSPSAPVTWSVNVGTIDANGLYTAPATLTSDQTAIVSAVSTNATFSLQATVQLLGALKISPDDVVLSPGGTQHYTVTPNIPVTWTVNTGGGAIDADGTYHAPATVTQDMAVNVIARATDGSGRSDGVNLTVKATAAPALQIQPSTQVQLKAGETQQFTLTPDVPVSWSVEGDGTITATGLYTAPAGVTTTHTVTIKATDGSQRTAQVLVTVLAPPPTGTRSITPSAVTLRAGESQKFTVTPASDVSWGTTKGTIDQNGVYTAPAVIAADTTATVFAFAADDSFNLQATVTLLAEAGAVTFGDVNGDKKVNVADATLLLRAAVGLVTLNADQKKAGDVNGDGKLNVSDATLALRFAVGLITKFPVQP